MDIEEIIGLCNRLPASGSLVVSNFGKNQNLTLHICRDEEFEMVRIHTFKDGIVVDDTEDVHIYDSLHEELDRLFNYRNFRTL